MQATPMKNSYWVIPGRFLAGEYPRTKDAGESLQRMMALCETGITWFVDLTTPDDQMLPYESLLWKLSHGNAVRHAMPILDQSVPTVDQMRRILDIVDHGLERGERVMVHCWGGVGRTGTVIGCWLARHNTPGIAPLDQYRALWKTCPKSATRPCSPENRMQEDFIRDWPQHDQHRINKHKIQDGQ